MPLPNTPTLGLRQWTETEPFDELEVNSNFTKVDTAIGAAIATSGARPTTGLFPGKRIFETDTQLFYVWDGDSWVYDTASTPSDLSGYDLKALSVANEAARPATGLYTGRVIYQEDVDKFYVYRSDPAGWVEIFTSGTWTTYTPAIVGPTTSSLDARWRRQGDDIEVEVFFVVATQGTAATPITVALPVNTMSLPVGLHHFGDCNVKDASGQYYRGACAIQVDVIGAQSVMTFYLPSSGTSALDAKWTTTTPFALASPDNLSARFRYRVA